MRTVFDESGAEGYRENQSGRCHCDSTDTEGIILNICCRHAAVMPCVFQTDLRRWSTEKIQDFLRQTRSIAVALDGPLGPRHEPKKTGILSAEQAQESFVEFQFLIMDVFGCSGDGTTMRFHFRFRKSSSQFTIMEKSIKTNS